MITRRAVSGVLVAGVMAALLPVGAVAEERIDAVATFSILGDMVAEIGGERVDVTTLVGPDGDAHVYQPTPADARAVAEADVLFVNGLGFEGWIDRLVEASGYTGPVVVTTTGMVPLSTIDDDDHHDEGHEAHESHDAEDHAEHDHDAHEAEDHAGDNKHAHEEGHHEEEHDDAKHDHSAHHETEEDHAETGHHGHDHGDVDPHAWQSLTSAKIYAANIADALTEIDPAGADVYAANLDRYQADLAALDSEIKALVASLPEDRRTVITSHDSFGYFEQDYGLHFMSPQGMSTESEASAADVAALIRQIRDNNISAVFVENVTDPRLVQQIADETGARVGGTLYSDALSGSDGPASTYLSLMRHNMTTMAAALGS